MSEEVKGLETQEGVSLEHPEEEKREYHEEVSAKEKEVEVLFPQKDIIRNFLFYELISKPVSMRR